MFLNQWFLAFPILPPFNPALLVVVIPRHKIISLLLPSWTKFATVLNHNANNLLSWVADVWPPKGLQPAG